MTFRYLDKDGAISFWTNIKNYILSKIPTKTSELTNDSGFLTQHQSLANYVDLSSTQTITGKKLFTASSIQLDSVTSMYGSTMLIDTSASAPRGQFPAETHRVGRIYIGDGQSYNGAWFIVDPTIDTNKAYYRMVTTNPDNTDSTRFSIVWDSTKEGVRRRKNVSQGDLLPSGNNIYNLGADDLKWDIGYIHNLIGSNKENASEDANNYYSTTSGSHMTFYTTTNGGTKLSNVPAAVNTQLESRTIRYLSASDWNVEQICHNTNGLYYRKGNNNGWGDWKTFAFTDSNITGTAANVTGTVAIANGGTGATTRLNAIKNLTNEAVGTPTHFLAITTNWGKAGYTTVAQAKTVLGITGDMGSHSDSEYVHKTGNETIAGTKTFSSTITGSISGNAGTATQFSANKSVTLTGDVTGTASSKAGWSVATTLANSGVTAGTYGPSADVTGNNNATISVPEITVDAKGRVTSVTNRTYTSVNTDTNTDTKVTQTVTNANSNYPIILSATADKTATSTEAARFTTALYANARYGYLYQKNTYASACKIGTAPTSDTVVARIYQKDYNGDDATQIYTQINKTTGHVRSYWRVYNKITSGALDPSATATSTYLDLTMGTAGKTIATDALWDSNLTPLANNSKTLGTSSLQWKGAYAVNFYENGTALSSKYAQVNNISANGIGTTCLLAYFPGGTSDLSLVTGETKPGTSLCVVYWRLESTTSISNDIYTSTTGILVVNRGYTETGTWKLLHSMSQGVGQQAMIGVWVRIL